MHEPTNTDYICAIPSLTHTNTNLTFYTQIMFKLKRLQSKSISQGLISDQRTWETNGSVFIQWLPLNVDANWDLQLLWVPSFRVHALSCQMRLINIRYVCSSHVEPLWLAYSHQHRITNGAKEKTCKSIFIRDRPLNYKQNYASLKPLHLTSVVTVHISSGASGRVDKTCYRGCSLR